MIKTFKVIKSNYVSPFVFFGWFVLLVQIHDIFRLMSPALFQVLGPCVLFPGVLPVLIELLVLVEAFVALVSS